MRAMRLLIFLAALLAPAAATAQNFVRDGTTSYGGFTLPVFPKSTLTTVPSGLEKYYLRSSDWNIDAQAHLDTRSWLRGDLANWFGCTETADPAPSGKGGVGQPGYVYCSSSDHKLHLHINGADSALGAGGGGTVNGLLAAYQGASSAAQNIIGLTSTLGPVLVLDNATPIGGSLFGVQSSSGGSKFLDVTATGASVSGTFGVSGGLTTLTIDDATTNNVTNVATLLHSTSGTAASSIGTGLLFRSENSSGSVVDAIRIAGVLGNVTAGFEASSWVLQTRTAGAALADTVQIFNSDAATAVVESARGNMYLLDSSRNGFAAVNTTGLLFQWAGSTKITMTSIGQLVWTSGTGANSQGTLQINGVGGYFPIQAYNSGGSGRWELRDVSTGVDMYSVNGGKDFIIGTQGTSRAIVFSSQSTGFNTARVEGPANQTASVFAVKGGATPGAGANLLDLMLNSGVSVFIVDNAGRIKNANSANEATTATAGTNGAPPATVQGYIIFTDSSGTARKIPYYAM